MPGTSADPVILDPWQEIIEVGWSDEVNLTTGAVLQKAAFQSSSENCDGDGMESFNLNDHSGSYITVARLSPDNVPNGSGFLGEIPVTFSGFNLGNVDHTFGEWEFAQKAFDANLDKTCIVTGTAVNLSLNNVDGLDGAPSCRDLPGVGTGRVSAERTGAAVASGPSYDFSGGTAVEIGGLGRTFSVDHITLAGDSENFVSVNIYMVED